MKDLNQLNSEDKSEESENSMSNMLADSALSELVEGSIDLIVDGVASPVVVFLRDTFRVGSEKAIEVASKLPQDVIEQIEKVNVENVGSVTSWVVDRIKSIELPDIDLSDIDFPDIDIDL